MIKHFIIRANTNDDYFDNRAVAMLVTIDKAIVDTAIKLTKAVNELGVYQISVFDSSPIGIPSGIIEDEDLLQTLDNCDEEAIEITKDEYEAIVKAIGDGAISIDSMTMQVDKDSIMWDGYYKYVNIAVQSGHVTLKQMSK